MLLVLKDLPHSRDDGDLPRNALRSRPHVLRELAAEVGATRPSILQLASEVLLDELLNSTPVGEVVEFLSSMEMIDADTRAIMLSGGSQREAVMLASSRIMERLHRPSSSHGYFYRGLQNLFQKSVDAILHKEYGAHGAKATVTSSARHGVLREIPGMGAKIISVVAGQKKAVMEKLARFILGEDAPSFYGSSIDKVALELVERADALGRIPLFLGALQSLIKSSDDSQVVTELLGVLQSLGIGAEQNPQ